MNDGRTDLPGVGATNFSQRVREAIQTYMGRQGDPLDRGLTIRDLLENGIIALKSGFSTNNLKGSITLPLGPGSALVTYTVDLTPPPTPTGFTATAAISNILIESEAQLYTQGNGHLKTVVYGATWISGALPVFSSAVKITEFGGTVHGYPTNPATTWHLWAKWMTNDGVLSSAPAGGTNGVVVTTGQNVATLLEALTGEITASQLYADLGARIDLIDGTGPGSVSARILVETLTREEADDAIALHSTTLAARLDTGDYAAVKVQSSASANSITGLSAQYTVKVDVNGHVSGFGLASTLRDGVPTSEFIIRADQFAIAPVSTDNAAADGSPFFYRTVATVINGVSVPAGAYMKAAFLHDATITNAKIALLAVDDGNIIKLAVDKLTAGSIAVGQYIQSTGYVAGSAGWRILGNGNAEFSGVTVRGTVVATAGLIGGNTIDAAGMQSPNYAAGSAGWRINSDGTFYANTGNFRGAINVGAFTGYAWPAAGGTGAHLSAEGLLLGNFNDGKYFQVTGVGNLYSPGFSIINGVMTIDQFNVIKTLNIAGNAVTTSVFASAASAQLSVGSTPVTASATVLNISGLADGQTSGVIITGYTTLYEGGGNNVTVVTDITVNGTVVVQGACTLGESKTTTLAALAQLGNGNHAIDIRVYVPPQFPAKLIQILSGLTCMNGKR